MSMIRKIERSISRAQGLPSRIVPDRLRAQRRVAFRDARAKAGLTQEEAAARCCVTVSAVRQWESGRCRNRVPDYAIKLIGG